MVTAPLPGYQGLASVDYVVFSGGVSEYVYGHEAAASATSARNWARRFGTASATVGHGSPCARPRMASARR